jgi:hypothetical protein
MFGDLNTYQAEHVDELRKANVGLVMTGTMLTCLRVSQVRLHSRCGACTRVCARVCLTPRECPDRLLGQEPKIVLDRLDDIVQPLLSSVTCDLRTEFPLGTLVLHTGDQVIRHRREAMFTGLCVTHH